MNNYVVTIWLQAESDAEVMQKAAKIAKDSGEIAYIKHSGRDLGFFTKDGDYGPPKIKETK